MSSILMNMQQDIIRRKIMMNLRKIEKIAAKLEEELGLNDAGDELIDKAEEEVAKEENVQESIDENIENEKKEEALPESPLEASAEEAPEVKTDEVAPPATAPEAPVAAEDEFDNEGAKACIASLQKLLKIAKAVKMSKDMPACTKEEVLGKIQKASEKFRNAANGGNDEEGETQEKLTNTNSRQKTKDDAAGKFIQFVTSNRSALTKLLNGGAKSQPISTVLGSNVMGISTPAGKLTPLQLIHIFKALLSK